MTAERGNMAKDLIAERVGRVSERYKGLLDQADDAHEWAFAWRTEVNRGGFRAVDFLMDVVVDTGRCIGCAACVSICPVDVFDYAEEKPVDTRESACVHCVLCAEACPVLRPADNDLTDILDLRSPTIDDGYGPYAYACYSRATDPELLSRGQDGGMVSALLLHGMDEGSLKAAVLGDVTPENCQIGCPKLAHDRAQVLSCAGSRYTYSPNTLALQQATREQAGPIAVVGVPCQVDGVRLQQNSSIRLGPVAWLRQNVKLVIGLFCSESFTHESIVKLAEILEVAPERIKNINIKGKVVVTLDDGSIVSTSLKRYREWARPACLYCTDYGAENADIGAGGIGLDGWTYTIIRTEAGHRAFQKAITDGWIEARPLDDEPRGEFLMKKLAADKKLNRPHPAQMPTLAERQAQNYLDPKTYYTKGPGAPQTEVESKSQ